MEDIYEFAKHLPEAPRPEMVHWVNREHYDDLGGNLCVFHRESVELETVHFEAMMSYEDMLRYENGFKYRWAAKCQCTACGAKFTTGWLKEHGKRYGIRMFVGEDGTNYDGYVPEKGELHPDTPWLNNYGNYIEGDDITCPYCGEAIELIHRSRLRHGRIYQLMVTSVEVVDGYAALVTWLAHRYIDAEHLTEQTQFFPREALVIDWKKLLRFKHSKLLNAMFYEQPLTEWQPANYYNDDFTLHRYHSWGGINNKCVGSAIFKEIPDLTDTTGEKTGLAEYMNDEHGNYPFAYIRMWRKHPNIENIVKSKWRLVLDTELAYKSSGSNYCTVADYSIETDLFDFWEVAPHKMLGISRQASREDLKWDNDALRTYHLWQFVFGDVDIYDFDFWYGELGDSVMQSLVGMMSDYDCGYQYTKIMDYILDQAGEIEPCDAAQLYIDYRDMLGDGNFTYREIFPKNVCEAHDRLVKQQEIKKQSKLKKQFAELAEKYAELEWTDGELCIRIAQTEQELVQEGMTLHHCVGGYGQKHTNETDCIFFVRRYRRPERSYYTLDINMTRTVPSEVQLHGYRNEWCNKLRIPDKVRKFVDRWEKEVLLPTVAKQRQTEAVKNNRRKEKVA